MPRSRKNKKKTSYHHPEAKGIFFIALSILFFLSISSFVDQAPEENFLGLVGYTIAFGLHYTFGLGSYLVASYLTWMGWHLVKYQKHTYLGAKTLYFCMLLTSVCILLNLYTETSKSHELKLYSKVYSETAIVNNPIPTKYVRYNLGGVPFYYIYRDLPYCNLQFLLSDLGTFSTFFLIALVSLILLTEFSLFSAIHSLSNALPVITKNIQKFLGKIAREWKKTIPKHLKTVPSMATQQFNKVAPPPPYSRSYIKPRKRPIPQEDGDIEDAMVEIEVPRLPLKSKSQKKVTPPAPDIQKKTPTKSKYTPPSLSLLTPASRVNQPSLKKELSKRALILEETLLSFGIEAKVGKINAGPTITSIEIHPAIGVKVQKIKSLENDIALNLQAKSIRIIAPIPGKAAVGIEIPSLYPQEVGFLDMLENYRKSSFSFQIPMLLGKTVTGEDVMCELTKMPHCIIAGATGSGKSVCINTIILSIIMNKSPEDVKLLLIDPKKVELTPFSGLAHLIAPVISEPAGAYSALNWLVKEMQGRYILLKQLGVRNIDGYNNRKRDVAFEDSLEMEIPERMHYIVAIIDEFADLMMTSTSDLETPIARIAQMARAVGIHLILATQRPSREVITGIIKANFPTRISFKVSSRINSQIILDENGAETLLGNGDMLFLPPGTSQLIRAQGVFVRDEDITRIIQSINDRYPTNYLIKSFEQMEHTDLFDEPASSSKDALYDKALEIVLSYRSASTTFLQRKLKIGYARAASLIDELEENGVISSNEGNKPRKILKDQP